MEAWQYECAADLGLTGTKRLCSIRRESGIAASGLRFLWHFLVKVVLRIWNRFEICGLENLPSQPPFVIVANHSSHLDAVVLASALSWRWRDHISPLAAGDYFFDSLPVAGFAAGVLNSLPIWRERLHGQRHQLADLRDRLIKQSAIYIVFPEGTRSRDGQMHPFKPGFATLIAATNIPVIPCRLNGNCAALPPGSILLRPRKIKMIIGRPMTFLDTPNHASGWLEITRLVQRATRDLEQSAEFRQGRFRGCAAH
jgi:1-acyl-sn-glycerol-3-phosphate acyltransferase